MKRTIITLSVILVSIIALLLLAPSFIDLNKYTPKITELVKQKTGVDVKIDGKLSLRLLPDISLKIEGISVVSPVKNDGNIVSISELILKLKIWPLLQKRIEVDSFRLVDPHLYIHAITPEKSNISILLEGLNREKSNDDGSSNLENNASENDEIASQPLHEMLNFKNIRIKNGTLRLRNDESGQDILILDVNLTTALSSSENPIEISAKLNVFEDVKKGRLSLRGKYFIAEDKYGLQDAMIIFDDIKSHVNFEANTGGATPDIKASLYFEDINLNGYKSSKGLLGNAEEPSEAPANKNHSSPFEWSEEPIDLSVLDSANLNVKFKASSFKFNEIETGKMMVNSYLRNSKLTVNVGEANVYGGKITSEIVVDNSLIKPEYSSKVNVEKLNFSEVPIDFVTSLLVKGSADFSVDLESEGNNLRNIISNLGGKVFISSKNGGIRGVDLASMISGLASKFNINTRGEDSKKKMSYDEISGDFFINKGVLSNDNLVLKSDVFNFAGDGNIDLNNLTIDYNLKPKYSKDFTKNKGVLDVPVSISGDLRKPVFRLEVVTIVEDLIENPESANELIDKFKDDFKDIKKNFNKDILNDLKGLF